LFWAVWVLAVASARAADPNAPHPHNGVLTKYERKHPSKYGITLAGLTSERLRRSQVCRMLVMPNGYKRCTAIREVNADADLVFSRILDFAAYPQMIQGVVRCDVYRRRLRPPATMNTYAKYRVRELGVSLEAFMAHEYDLAGRCLTFSLDYGRRSDMSDTVGYWYVEALPDGWSRLYYSIDTALPPWIPPVVRDSLLGLAAKRATGWVEAETRRIADARHVKAGAHVPAVGLRVRRLGTRLQLGLDGLSARCRARMLGGGGE